GDLPKVVREKNVEGVLLMQQVSENLVADVKAAGVAAVGVDSHPFVKGLDSFYVDNEKGAALACKALLDDGHDNIVMLTGGGRDVVSIERRRQAFLRTLKEAGHSAKASDTIVKAGGLNFQEAYATSLHLLAS